MGDGATPAPTGAPVEAPTPAPMDAPTPAPTPPSRRLRSRRLAAGEMLVVARFSEAANITLSEVEAASATIVDEVNKALTGANATVTVSSLTVSAPAPTVAPTPAPASDASPSAAVISRVDLWVSALALVLCSGRV